MYAPHGDRGSEQLKKINTHTLALAGLHKNEISDYIEIKGLRSILNKDHTHITFVVSHCVAKKGTITKTLKCFKDIS